MPKVKQYPTDVVLLDKYINGNQLTRTEMKKVKKLLSMTVITSNNAEKAKNKPIVNGKINNNRSKFFLDSGADINIIDKNFGVQKLGLQEKDIRAASSSIRCANGTKMKVLGECSLDVEIGGSFKTINFYVVDQMFPNVILGIVALKQLQIILCPEQSCIFTKTEMVSFLSKVEETSKNVNGLYLGAKMKLSRQ